MDLEVLEDKLSDMPLKKSLVYGKLIYETIDPRILELTGCSQKLLGHCERTSTMACVLYVSVSERNITSIYNEFKDIPEIKLGSKTIVQPEKRKFYLPGFSKDFVAHLRERLKWVNYPLWNRIECEQDITDSPVVEIDNSLYQLKSELMQEFDKRITAALMLSEVLPMRTTYTVPLSDDPVANFCRWLMLIEY